MLLACVDENRCPIDKPSDGAGCDTADKVCECPEIRSTGDIDCDEPNDAFRCEAGEWVKCDWECSCPNQVPEAGSDCLGYHDMITGCSYVTTTACGEEQVFPTCGKQTDYRWEWPGAEDCSTP